MPYIGRAATNAGSVNYLDDISSGFDGNDVTFTCAVKGTTITPGQENVYIYLDGVFQHPGESYTISGSTITFTEAPVSGVDFTAYVAGEGAYLDDGTVSTAKLDDDAVTASKLDDDGTGFQVGDLGVGGSLTSGDKLTVTGRLRASGGIIGDVTGDLTGNVTGNVTGNLTGNVTGNTSGSAATVTEAAQTAITSVGTLSSLTLGGDLLVPQYIKHVGDTDCHIEFGTDEIKLRTGDSSRLIARNSNVELYSALVATSATFSSKIGINGAIDSSYAGATIHGTSAIKTTPGDGSELRFKLYTGGAADASILQMFKADGSTIGVNLNTGGDSYFTGGNVAIGGTTASDKLDIHNGNARIRVGGLGLIQLKNDGSNHSLIIANNNGGSETIRFHTSGTSYLTGGNFGVGSSSPQRTFVISNGGAGGIEFGAGDTNQVMSMFNRSTSSYNNLDIEVRTLDFLVGNAADKPLTIDANGHFSIGHNSPASDALLHIKKDQSAYTRFLVENNTNSTSTQALGSFKSNAGTLFVGISSTAHSAGGDAIFNQTASGKGIRFFTNGSLAVKITASQTFESHGGFYSGSAGGGYDHGLTTHTNEFNPIVNWQSGYGRVHFSYRANNTYQDWTFYNGSSSGYTDLEAAAFNVTSDYRLKKTVTDFTTNVCDNIKELRPVTYFWKANTKMHTTKQIGFLAHELQEKLPLSVKGEKDAINEKGDIDPQTIKTEALATYIIKGMQEIIERLEALENN